MAFNEQVVKLVDKLTTLSREGKVAWEETADEHAFQVLVSKFVVTVRFRSLSEFRSPSDRNDADSLNLEILDQRGRFVDSVMAYPKDTDEWKRLEDLYELARRSALHVHKALADLLSALD